MNWRKFFRNLNHDLGKDADWVQARAYYLIPLFFVMGWLWSKYLR